jgi:DNA (cytosine-5)-methyltransferase 1
VSLYSGAGGLDKGLELSRHFRTEVFVEVDPIAVETLEANFEGTVIAEDIADVSTRTILRRADLRKGDDFLLAAGPPCQLWSHARFWLEDMSEVARDPAATTLDHFVRVLEESRPRAFIFENVWGLAYTTHAAVLRRLRARVKKSGYRAWVKVVNAADYGVPQVRRRLIMIGARDVSDEFEFAFPDATHGSLSRPYRTAGEALGRLVDRRDLAEDNEAVNGKWGHLLASIPKGDNYLFYTAERGHPKPIFKWRSKYWHFLLKLDPRKPSWTLAASPGPYTGPFHWRNRRLRVPEIQRLQSFTLDYVLAGNRREQRRQLGNAVPPRLANVMGRAIAQQLF